MFLDVKPVISLNGFLGYIYTLRLTKSNVLNYIYLIKNSYLKLVCIDTFNLFYY